MIDSCLTEILPHVFLAAHLQRLGGVGYLVADVLQVSALLGLAATSWLDALTNVPHEADAQSPGGVPGGVLLLLLA